MNTTTTRAFARPRHVFDLPAFTVLALAGVGGAAFALAHALNGALARRQTRWRERVPGPPGRPVERRIPAEYGVTAAWRIR